VCGLDVFRFRLIRQHAGTTGRLYFRVVVVARRPLNRHVHIWSAAHRILCETKQKDVRPRRPSRCAACTCVRERQAAPRGLGPLPQKFGWVLQGTSSSVLFFGRWIWIALSVRECVFYVFFRFKKHDFLRFWNDVSKSRKSHTKLSSLLNVYRNFDLKTPECYGYLTTHRHFSHTVLSCIVSCVRTFEQDVWCFYVFFVFFKSKKHDFLRFLSCCTRFLELWLPWL